MARTTYATFERNAGTVAGCARSAVQLIANADLPPAQFAASQQGVPYVFQDFTPFDWLAGEVVGSSPLCSLLDPQVFATAATDGTCGAPPPFTVNVVYSCAPTLPF